MSPWEAALIGVIQGITEFIPISSTTHLVVVPALLGMDPPSLAFITLLHLGSLVALLTYFARDLQRIVAEAPARGSEGRRMILLLAIGTVPAAVVGLLFEATFERLLTHPRGVAFSLLITAAILLGAEWAAGTIPTKRRLPRPLRPSLRTWDALGIGVGQAAALFPGVSRSGATMSAGLFLGIRRDVAARFSFMLAIPAITGANVLQVPTAVEEGIGTPEIVGTVAALVSSYAAVAFLLRYLRARNFLPFAAYCVVFALVSGTLLS